MSDGNDLGLRVVAAHPFNCAPSTAGQRTLRPPPLSQAIGNRDDLREYITNREDSHFGLSWPVVARAGYLFVKRGMNEAPVLNEKVVMVVAAGRGKTTDFWAEYLENESSP